MSPSNAHIVEIRNEITMNKRSKNNAIRLISGKWKGRKLEVMDSEGLRPTIDRVRETLFNWLMYEINGARCLDLFAGSGALGFEALSRGARFVQFVELNKKVSKSLVTNMKKLEPESTDVDVTIGSALDFLSRFQGVGFDIVFLDPPFGEKLLPDVIDVLAESQALIEGSAIFVEQDKSDVFDEFPQSWTLHRQGVAGQSDYRLYFNSTS